MFALTGVNSQKDLFRLNFSEEIKKKKFEAFLINN